MKSIIFLAGILLPVLSYSQQTDSIGNSPRVTAAPRLGGFTLSTSVAPIKAAGNTFIMQNTVAELAIPLLKDFSGKHPIFIKTGVRYHGLFLSDEKNIGSNNFHSLTVPLLMSYSFSRSTNITFIGLASVNSDFKRRIEADDILYTAGVRLGFQKGRMLRYGVTMTYIRNYSGTFLLPVPDIDWTISKKVSLSAIVPARLSLKYKLTEAQSLGITGGFSGNVFALNDDKKKQYLQLQQYIGGLLYDVIPGQRWKINLIAARTFSQKLETFDMDQKVSFNGFNKLKNRITNVSYRQNSFLFQASISYAF